MSAITASAVKSLRERTGLPMMDCKKALTEANGDENAAIDLLRKKGAKVAAERSGRDTGFGRVGLHTSPQVGAMVELKCESAPVAKNEEFIQLASDLAEQLATGPGAASADELLAQPSPSKQGMTLQQQLDDLFNRIREVFKVGRIRRIDGPCGGYSHNAATVAGVLVEATGDESKVKDICMHIAAMSPRALNSDELDPATVNKEREILHAAAIAEGKPENIAEKMVEGGLRKYFAETVLLDQPFVKEQKQSVAQFAKDNGIEVRQFVHWQLGEEE